MVLPASVVAARLAIEAKRQARFAKKVSVLKNEIGALPKIPKVILDANYVNPVTLEFPKGVTIYEIKNRFTGRTNYYTKATFKKIIARFKSDYDLLMMNPKVPIPGARNPVTRNPIYPRNVRRVKVKAKSKTPTKSAAARKIQSAVRKHLAKKRARK
jgi:hypothetical protein